MFEAIMANLPEIWLVLIAFFVLYYAITDGLDLGVGMISLFAKNSEECGTMMGSIRSNWHSNESWLVILGGMLFGAFPIFYGVIFSALYIPVMVMLFGLIFRGISFEMRDHSERKRIWDLSFGGGSLTASVGQGFAFGGILSGYLRVESGEFTGSPWEWLNPYALLVTVGLLTGYIMLGANYLILKTEGYLQDRSYRIAWLASLFVAPVAVTVHIWTIFKYPHVAQKWQSYPGLYFVAGFTVIAALTFIMLLICLKKRFEIAPVFLNAALVIFSFAAISTGMYPNMIPNEAGGIDVRTVAASSKTLIFMLYASVIVLPVVLLYTSYEYWVFRGKTQKGMQGYQD